MQLASGLTSDSLGQDEGDGHEGGPQQQRGVPHAGVPCHRGGLSREGESRQARVPQEGVLGEHRPRGRQEVPPRRLLHGAEAVRVQRPQPLGGAAQQRAVDALHPVAAVGGVPRAVSSASGLPGQVAVLHGGLATADADVEDGENDRSSRGQLFVGSEGTAYLAPAPPSPSSDGTRPPRIT